MGKYAAKLHVVTSLFIYILVSPLVTVLKAPTIRQEWAVKHLHPPENMDEWWISFSFFNIFPPARRT